MSASLTSALSKKSPKSLVELTAEDVIKQAIVQGKSKWILRAMRKHEDGKAVLDAAFPKPELIDVFYVFMKGPDSVHDDTEGLLRASKAPWLKILLQEHGLFANAPTQGSLGGYKLCWDEKSEAVEWASELIFQLDEEQLHAVVGTGLGIPVNLAYDEDGDGDGDDGDEAEQYTVSEWVENNVEEIEEALDTKFGELFDERALTGSDADDGASEFVWPETIKEWRRKNCGYNVLGSFHIEMTNWS